MPVVFVLKNSVSKSYKDDRFEKCLVFVYEVRRKFEKDIPYDVYRIYIHRFWQAVCRVLCSQEIMYGLQNNIKYTALRERLKVICTHSLTIDVLKSYPLRKLPLKQRLFAYAMKYRMYYIMKMLVKLRSR